MSEGRRATLLNVVHGLCQPVVEERRLSVHHLNHHDTQRPDVDLMRKGREGGREGGREARREGGREGGRGRDVERIKDEGEREEVREVHVQTEGGKEGGKRREVRRKGGREREQMKQERGGYQHKVYTDTYMQRVVVTPLNTKTLSPPDSDPSPLSHSSVS